jgi:hypothetical protein
VPDLVEGPPNLTPHMPSAMNVVRPRLEQEEERGGRGREEEGRGRRRGVLKGRHSWLLSLLAEERWRRPGEHAGNGGDGVGESPPVSPCTESDDEA